jgi:phytoene dehydrogenase-like protein
MRFRGESRRDVYDVIVVGSGIGGLTAAALLARAGRSVLVVERHDRVGGYAHAFRRGRYLFDSAVHLVGGCEPVETPGGGMIHSLLSNLGVRERCEFARIDPCYAAVYPGAALQAPCSIEGFVEVHAGEDRAAAKALRQFLQECLDIREETRRASQLPSPFGAVTDARRFPTLLRYRRATLAQVLDAQLDSPELKALVGTLWPYLGLPPSRLSFLYFANMLMSYLVDGAFCCRGSFQRFADALAAAITARGGEILLKSSVRRIQVEDGCVRGVVLEHGQRIESPLVLSNADARQTVEEMVGPEAFPARYVASLRRMKPSLSSFIVHAAASLPLDPRETCHETFLYSSFDHDRAHRSSLAGDPCWLSVTVPTLADPGLAPAGEHLLILTTLVPYGARSRWRAGKDGLARRLLGIAEHHFPGLGGRLEFVESGTPRTLERYTRNTDGALYGWELSPTQVGSGRLSGSTPITGLRLVGHWTQPGGGVYGVVSSGIMTARSVLGPGAELDLA